MIQNKTIFEKIDNLVKYDGITLRFTLVDKTYGSFSFNLDINYNVIFDLLSFTVEEYQRQKIEPTEQDMYVLDSFDTIFSNTQTFKCKMINEHMIDMFNKYLDTHARLCLRLVNTEYGIMNYTRVKCVEGRFVTKVEIYNFETESYDLYVPSNDEVFPDKYYAY